MTTRGDGFSLVELLIVIVMLGIVAVIAVPKLLDASEDARESALGTDLQ
ncbi:MAG TPA: prepilin-type N-terminal cleavage/methylation domain-containing protein, partial [Phycisphaerae bacterium]|nr:prepilin-type N-terminal cleavage/methylation domain-containing protein [Phycisphaerae bacterium]